MIRIALGYPWYLRQGEGAFSYFCRTNGIYSARENHGKISMITLTLYATPVQAGHADRHAVGIPTYTKISVNES